VARNVDVISAFGVPSTLAAKTATSTIPLIFAVGADPIKDGLVASLARPRGNLTGVAILSVELMAKRVELLSEVVLQAGVIAVLVNPTNPLTDPMIRDVQEAARAKGMRLLVLKASTESEIDASFASTMVARS